MDFSTTTSSNTSSDLAHRAGPPAELRTWYDDLNSPLIQSDGNDKSLKLRFDVSQYAPEEIVVKTVDNKLLVILHFLSKFLCHSIISSVIYPSPLQRRYSFFIQEYSSVWKTWD